jgi:putative protease
MAPAKDKQIGKEAILHGADAVYIGIEGFSARSAAGNSIEDIAELADLPISTMLAFMWHEYHPLR